MKKFDKIVEEIMNEEFNMKGLPVLYGSPGFPMEDTIKKVTKDSIELKDGSFYELNKKEMKKFELTGIWYGVTSHGGHAMVLINDPENFPEASDEINDNM